MKLIKRIKNINERSRELILEMVSVKNAIISGIRSLPDINGDPIDWCSDTSVIVVKSSQLKFNFSAEYFIFKSSYEWMIEEIQKARNDDLDQIIDMISHSNVYNKDSKPVYYRATRGGCRIQLNPQAVENFNKMLEKL